MATASTIINMASKEIGVKETGVNNVKYNYGILWTSCKW
mgnify:CR=1 FL=1